MTRREFMARLESCLICIDRGEREAALRYYGEYFDDAGPEREAEVISSLGSPEALAREIIAEAGEGAKETRRPPEAPADGPSEFHSIKADIVNATFTVIRGTEWRVDIDYPEGTPLPEVSIKDGVLSINEEMRTHFRMFRGGWKPGSINVTVPNVSFRSFNIESVNGTVNIPDVSVSTLHCETVNGLIDINGAYTDKLYGECVNGNVRMVSCRALNGCHAQTVNGTVTLGGELRGAIHAEAINGAIHISTSLPLEEYSVDISTVSGSVRVNGSKLGKSVRIRRNTENSIGVEGVNGGVTLNFAV